MLNLLLLCHLETANIISYSSEFDHLIVTKLYSQLQQIFVDLFISVSCYATVLAPPGFISKWGQWTARGVWRPTHLSSLLRESLSTFWEALSTTSVSPDPTGRTGCWRWRPVVSTLSQRRLWLHFVYASNQRLFYKRKTTFKCLLCLRKQFSLKWNTNEQHTRISCATGPYCSIRSVETLLFLDMCHGTCTSLREEHSTFRIS